MSIFLLPLGFDAFSGFPGGQGFNRLRMGDFQSISNHDKEIR
jgi:hypothetical protein